MILSEPSHSATVSDFKRKDGPDFSVSYQYQQQFCKKQHGTLSRKTFFFRTITYGSQSFGRNEPPREGSSFNRTIICITFPSVPAHGPTMARVETDFG